MPEPPSVSPPRVSPTSSWLVFTGLTLPTLVTWLYFDALNGQSAAWQQLSYAVGKIMQFSLPIVWWWNRGRRDRLPLTDRSGLAVGLLSGTVIGLAVVILYVGVLHPGGVFKGPQQAMESKVVGLGITTPWAYAGLAVFYSLAHSLLEEIYWRWFIFGDLRERLPLPTAVGLSSIGFMAHHVLVLQHYFGWNSPWTYVFSAGVAVGGVIWSLSYARFNSLLGPWMSHLLVDAAIFAVGYHLIAAALQA